MTARVYSCHSFSHPHRILPILFLDWHLSINSFYLLRLFSENFSVFMRFDQYRPTLTWSYSSPNTFFGQPYYSEIFISLKVNCKVQSNSFNFDCYSPFGRDMSRLYYYSMFYFLIFSILLSFTVHQKQIKSPCSYQDLWLNHCFTRFSMVSITSMQTGCFTETW